MINPAYMNRMVQETAGKASPAISHITSLTPLGRENAPDTWESEALKLLMRGKADEVSIVAAIGGKPFLRLMRPLITEESCRQCHTGPGYELGGIGGGISESVPMAPLNEANREHIAGLALGYTFLWLVGLVGIVTGARRQLQFEASLRQLSVIIEQSPVSVVMADASGRILYVNPEGLRVGIPRPTDSMRNHLGLISDYAGDDSERERFEGIWRSLQGGKTWSGELPRHLPDGTLIWEAVSLFPVEHHDGNSTNYVAIRSDITERKRTEDALQKMVLAVEQSPVSILITDPGGHIEYVNPYFVTATGYRPEEVIGQTPRIFKSGYTSPAEYHQLWQQIKSGCTWRGELHNRRKDGSLFWESATISPITSTDGTITHFIAIKEDVTERKQRDIELVVATERAEAGNRTKSQFLALMSHELRTPLNAIIGFADVIHEELAGPLGNHQYKVFSQQILDSGRILLNLINDILELAKLTSGGLDVEFTAFPLESLIKTSIAAVRARAEACCLHLTVEAPFELPWLDGDERGLQQALTHLLANAIKFTAIDGSVTLQVAITVDGNLTLAVRDTGIGIASENIEKVMRPFAQADSAFNRHFEGAGLGLPLACHLVELHGGWLKLESTVGIGTTVTLWLPKERLIMGLDA